MNQMHMQSEVKRKAVLVVEDDKSLADAYSIILESTNLYVENASNGLIALDKIADKHYDLILLDLKMPKMDGVTFLRAFRNKYGDAVDTKIIVFSNYDLQDEVKEAYTLGIDKYFLKSWAAPRDLLKIVDEVLNK